LQQVREVVPAMLKEIVLAMPQLLADDWIVQSAEWSGTGIAIVKVGAPGKAAKAVIKIAVTHQSVVNQHRESRVLSQLRSDPRTVEWTSLVPARLRESFGAGWDFVVEEAIGGVEVRSRLTDPTGRCSALRLAAEAIGRLHSLTASAILVDEAILDQWINSRLPVLARASQNTRAISRLKKELCEAWCGRTVVVSWIHGDYWPGNVLVSADDSHVTGIVDWEWAAPNELPVLDPLNMLIFARMNTDRSEVGAVVRGFLRGSAWTDGETQILNQALGVDEQFKEIDRPTMLLFWLRHVTLTMTHKPYLQRDWIWVARNVDQVLDAV